MLLIRNMRAYNGILYQFTLRYLCLHSTPLFVELDVTEFQYWTMQKHTSQDAEYAGLKELWILVL